MSSDDEMLRQVVLGELDVDAPRVRERARVDPRFARELEATLAVVHALERERIEREAVLAEVRALEAPLAALPRAGVRRAVLSPSVSPSAALPRSVAPKDPRRARPVVVVAALCAVAALVLFALRPWETERADPGRDFTLGDETLRCIEPRDDVASFELFRWDVPSTIGFFEVSVRDAHGRELASATVEGRAQWRPDPALHSAWPDEIEWRVRWLDDMQKELAHASATARRRR